MLHEFLTHHRQELIDRCRGKVSARLAPRATPVELEYGIPLFLDQLTGMLAKRAEQAPAPAGASGGQRAESSLDEGARSHGSELLRHDFTIDQVVHDYGDLCQSITELAAQRKAPITVEEFGVLNIRLDNAIASAVTEFTQGRTRLQADRCDVAMNERLGELAHELRNLLNTAILAIAAIKGGGAGFAGATAAALDRSLLGMRTLIDRTLAGVRLEAESGRPRDDIEIGRFVSEIRVAAALEASQKGCALTVDPVEPGLHVEADGHLLASAVANVLQNAFKFTRKGSHVVLRVKATSDRVLIEVADECGGLAPGVAGTMFRAFAQTGLDRSGLGLGLSLSRAGVESFGGTLSVRNIPNKGCVFVIDLPRTK